MTSEQIENVVDEMLKEERSVLLSTLLMTYCPECGERHEECACEQEPGEEEKVTAGDLGFPSQQSDTEEEPFI